MRELPITDTRNIPVGRIRLDDEAERLIAEDPGLWVLTPMVRRGLDSEASVVGFLLTAIPATEARQEGTSG